MDPHICPSCGTGHDEISGSIPVSLPTLVAAVALHERQDRVWCNDELCVLDDEHFFVYGSISLSVSDHPGKEFLWGAWAKVTDDDFFLFQDMLNDELRTGFHEFNGVLATDIPFYPPTLDIAVTIQTQAFPNRPLFQLDGSNHPLAVEQKTGIPAQHVYRIRSWFEGLKRSSADSS